VNQGRRKNQKFSGKVQVERAEHLDILQILPGNKGNGDVVDIDLVFLDQVQKEIQRTFKNVEFDFIAHINFYEHVKVKILSKFDGCVKSSAGKARNS
jgi:hypothetical protein